MIKRLFDVLIALFALLLLAPVMLVIAWQISRKLGSPVLFRQTRPGKDGKPFEMIKFRTMRDAVDVNGNPLPDAERMTPFGSFLRSTSLDELPELWNVLKGEMSFIGPRPERPVFVDEFKKQIPGYEYRHWLQTGITGLAQIEGKYSTPPEDKLRFDLLYAKTVSPLQDIQILLHTLKVMLMKDKTS